MCLQICTRATSGPAARSNTTGSNPGVPGYPRSCVRDVVFPAAGGEQKLRDLVPEYVSSAPAYQFQVYTCLRASCASHYRRMVPQVLQVLEFRSNNAVHQTLIEALELLKRYANRSQRMYPAREKVPLQGTVPPAIEELVRAS
jgi:hypothetical protein